MAMKPLLYLGPWIQLDQAPHWLSPLPSSVHTISLFQGILIYILFLYTVYINSFKIAYKFIIIIIIIIFSLNIIPLKFLSSDSQGLDLIISHIFIIFHQWVFRFLQGRECNLYIGMLCSAKTIRITP